MQKNLKEEIYNKILNNCIDKNGKEIDIDIILKSNIFEKSEYYDLKCFYGTTQSIKKIEEKEFEIKEKFSELIQKIDKLNLELKRIESLFYPEEEDEVKYIKSLNELSKLESKVRTLKRKQKEKDLKYIKLEEKYKKDNL